MFRIRRAASRAYVHSAASRAYVNGASSRAHVHSAASRASYLGASPLLAAALAVAALSPALSPAAAQTPQRGGTLTVGLAQDPLTVDPIRTGSFTERQFNRLVYEPLFDIAEDGTTVPFLAESYTLSEDGLTYTIKLRPGILFHDGTPLDAAAVAANWDRFANPDNRCRCLNDMAEFASWRVVDDLTVEAVLKEPNVAFPTVLADAPGNMVSPAAFQADPQAIGTNPVGTGPFKFVEWVRDDHFTAERFEDYWQEGKPLLDRVVLRGIQNTETLQAAFQSGQTQVILQPSDQFVARVKDDPAYEVMRPGGFGYEGVYMSVSEPPFDDVRVREAVARAMNRPLIAKTLLFGLRTPAVSPFGVGMADHKPVPEYPEYDEAKAKALVEAYGKPVEFTLIFNNSPQTQRFAQVLQQMWGAVGMKVTLEPLDQNRIVQNVVGKQFQAALFRWTGRADPHMNTYRFMHSHYADISPSSNYGRIKIPALDALLDQGKVEQDPAKRAAIYEDVSRVLAKELPYAFTYYVEDSIVAAKSVHGFQSVPDGLLRFDGLWVEK